MLLSTVEVYARSTVECRWPSFHDDLYMYESSFKVRVKQIVFLSSSLPRNSVHRAASWNWRSLGVNTSNYYCDVSSQYARNNENTLGGTSNHHHVPILDVTIFSQLRKDNNQSGTIASTELCYNVLLMRIWTLIESELTLDYFSYRVSCCHDC